MTVTVALISAVEFEAQAVRSALTNSHITTRGETLGQLGSLNIVHVNSGVGLVNAARAASLVIERHRPGLVINFGIGGAYPQSGCAIGDVLSATHEVMADGGVIMPQGIVGYELIALPLVSTHDRQYFNEFPVEGNQQIAASLAEVIQGSGEFLTVAAATGTVERAQELQRQYPAALCENMEGAAVAQVCLIEGVTMMELRGISNMVEARDLSRWDRETAARTVQQAVLAVLESLRP